MGTLKFLFFYKIHKHVHIYHRGLSSTVRKCVSRETGLEYAVKIIDKSQEEAITESIQAEIEVLTSLPPHKHISESKKKLSVVGLLLYLIIKC